MCFNFAIHLVKGPLRTKQTSLNDSRNSRFLYRRNDTVKEKDSRPSGISAILLDDSYKIGVVVTSPAGQIKSELQFAQRAW